MELLELLEETRDLIKVMRKIRESQDNFQKTVSTTHKSMEKEMFFFKEEIQKVKSEIYKKTDTILDEIRLLKKK